MISRAKGIYSVLGRNAVHPFPARMAPSLALRSLSELKKNSVVLDPMVGSGTVIAMARAHGHRCIGFDIDPLAVLISKVWTHAIDTNEVRNTASGVLSRAHALALSLSKRESYPLGSDDETKEFVRYWFDDYVRGHLAAISHEIMRVSDVNVRDALWCAFSRMVITKSSGVSLAMDLSHSRPHRSYERAPKKPFRIFLDSVERVLEGCIHRNEKSRGPAAKVRLGDARNMAIPDRFIDLIFTSPPYLNAIDYLRCSKFSLVWMGWKIHELRSIRSASIGAESLPRHGPTSDRIIEKLQLNPAIPSRTTDILRRYIEDSRQAVSEVSRVLKKNGKAVYVVGENTIRGNFIPTGRLTTLLAEDVGLRLIHKHYRKLPDNRRYLPPPSASGVGLDSRMRREVVLTFEKS